MLRKIKEEGRTIGQIMDDSRTDRRNASCIIGSLGQEEKVDYIMGLLGQEEKVG